MSACQFEAWPKTPRLFRNAVITEKIDGTNSAVIIEETVDFVEGDPLALGWIAAVTLDGKDYLVGAQSRNRLITPGKQSDNYGFAAWVRENCVKLVAALGPGRHFGEWWGQGIARGYRARQRYFSLFNTQRFGTVDFLHEHGLPNVGTVPILYEGPFTTDIVDQALAYLKGHGSLVSFGFDKPEGVVVYHEAARHTFKVLLENDAAPKGARA